MNTAAQTLTDRILTGIAQFEAKHGKRPEEVLLNHQDHLVLMAAFDHPMLSEPRKFAGLQIALDERFVRPALAAWVVETCD